MKFWQSLAFVEMEQMPELARFCEELGFYGVSYGDHLITTKDQVDEYLYRDNGNVFWNPETHWPDPWVTVGALAAVDYVVPFSEDTPAVLIRALAPDVLVKGADWKPGAIVGRREVLAKGGTVRRVSMQSKLSTSQIIRRIRSQNSSR